MASDERTPMGPIGVGAVGVTPDPEGGLPLGLPEDERFELVAFSDEGLEEQGPDERPVAYYGDYNMLLQDPAVELVLAEGPVELRRDLAVRALNAGRHVVLGQPFCESALDAERVMKTAVRRGLVATADMRGRDDPDLRALQVAVEAENVGPVEGLFCFYPGPEPDPEGEQEGLLGEVGLAVLDQVNIVLRQDVKSVSAHVQRPVPGRPDDAFLIYLPLRGGGWAVCQSARRGLTGLPRWVLYAGGAAFTVSEGVAVTSGSTHSAYGAPETPQGFWDNLYAAVRDGADLKSHPVEIVRAMKLHEAAVASAESGEPVVV